MNWRGIALIIGVVFVVTLLVLVRGITGKVIVSEPSIIVSCPTMHSLSDELFPDATQVKTGSAAESLLLLNQGRADVAIIGRTATPYEGVGLESCALAQGVTLVTDREKQAVAWEELKEWRICTTLPIDSFRSYFPSGTTLVEEEYCSGEQTANLKNWQDVNAEDSLLIPMLGGMKDPRFRAPFLYTKSLDMYATPCCDEEGCPSTVLWEDSLSEGST